MVWRRLAICVVVAAAVVGSVSALTPSNLPPVAGVAASPSPAEALAVRSVAWTGTIAGSSRHFLPTSQTTAPTIVGLLRAHDQQLIKDSLALFSALRVLPTTGSSAAIVAALGRERNDVLALRNAVIVTAAPAAAKRLVALSLARGAAALASMGRAFEHPNSTGFPALAAAVQAQLRRARAAENQADAALGCHGKCSRFL